jgi:hypothetical protein
MIALVKDIGVAPAPGNNLATFAGRVGIFNLIGFGGVARVLTR